MSISPVYADITDQLERKITGVTIYESQLERLFDGDKEMARPSAPTGTRSPSSGAVAGAAERYWVSGRA